MTATLPPISTFLCIGSFDGVANGNCPADGNFPAELPDANVPSPGDIIQPGLLSWRGLKALICCPIIGRGPKPSLVRIPVLLIAGSGGN